VAEKGRPTGLSKNRSEQQDHVSNESGETIKSPALLKGAFRPG
jgi:hypothetical protein